MSATMCEAKRGKSARARTVIRVAVGDRYLGDILLDDRDRVWRRAGTIPADVVLKALLGVTRKAETCGLATGRTDGRTYAWYVLGTEQQAAA